MKWRKSEIPEHLLIFFEESGEVETIHNNHPTVKPIDIMRELVRLVNPPGSVCLEPFAGSGTTLLACKEEKIDFVGIERESEYVRIAKMRLEEN